MRIAIIDDDVALASSVSTALARNGWTCRSHADGRSFIATLHRESYDAYIVDWGLPDMSGLDVLRAIRTRVPVTVPVLFLTARDAEHDVIEALEAGADDFVVKPARIGELQARLRALWRRNSRPPDAPDTYEYDRFRFELKLQRAWVDGAPVDLTQKEFMLAVLLLRNLGKPLSRGHIREVVWGRDSEIPSRTMDTHVSRVRSKLGLRPERQYLLAPVYSYGYRLEHLLSSTVAAGSAPCGDPA
jgi:two-component system, OmpR family, response regulator RegX3